MNFNANKPSSDYLKGRIINSPSSSFWLKDAVRALGNRDTLDALQEAAELLEFCATKCRENGIAVNFTLH